MSVKNHIIKVRFSQEELQTLNRAVQKLNEVLNFSRCDLIRKGARDFAMKVLSVKELKIVGLE